jgi:hypothetical protein
MQAANQNNIEYEKQLLLNSFQRFVRVFFELRTGRKYIIPTAPGRENHVDQICRALMRVFKGECKRLIIAVPPRYGKTELLIHWCCWVMAHYADSNFIYVSYSHSLAKKQTQTIREIMQMMQYRELFNIEISDDTSAKDNFETKKKAGMIGGGGVRGLGSGGTIVGIGAGVKGVIGRCAGAIVIDDIHKPDEATSDVIREGIIDWFYNTLQSRTNSPETPIVFIGQRVHEGDLAAHLIATGEWEVLSIPVIDEAGNPLDPDMHSLQQLKKMQLESPYIFNSQYMQNPTAPGGAVFQEDWFVLHEEEPKLIAGLIVCDTAETTENYNDATVFSFFGVSEIWIRGAKIEDMYGLHWIDCREMRIEPKDLHSAFLQFWAECRRHPVGVNLAAIERKSTGVTLCSTLKDIPGLRLLEVERSGKTNSKTNRFLETQPFVSQRRISLPAEGKHTRMCIDHMKKITANNVHRFDDIADTLCDAVKIALIDKVVINAVTAKADYRAIGNSFNKAQTSLERLRQNAYKH